MRAAPLPAALLLAVTAVLVPTPAVQAEAPAATGAIMERQGRMIPTGGTLDFRDPPAAGVPRAPRVVTPRKRPATLSASPVSQDDWLYDLVARLIDGEPAARPRRMARAAKSPAAASLLPPPVAGPPALSADGAARPDPRSQITTGTLVFPRVPGQLDGVLKDDIDASIISDAEKSQARNDLVKLELARRSYDETRLSGASAFERRTDWRILERARDALSDAELSASKAAGFEANAYINDTSKIIVVAIAGTQDLRRDFIEADIWRALIKAQAPQHFFLAKSYIRLIQQRYQAQGYVTECVGHSLGGGACAYAASELGIRAVVVNPISAGRLGDLARHYVTNYVVDGDIAAAIYALRGNELSGDVQLIKSRRDTVRQQLNDKYGPLAGPIRVIRDIQNSVKVHQIDRALDLLAAHAETDRVK